MIVPDTSVWVEYLRNTQHPSNEALAGLIRDEASLGLTECVVMEILAGARSEAELGQLHAMLLPFHLVRLGGLADFEEAARIYWACRTAGQTLRKQIDCLIAVAVIRAGAELLHNDADFDIIARHSELRIHPMPALR